MGISLLDRQSFLVRALLASLALHVAFALCIPAVAWLDRPGPPVETLSFVPVVHISIETPHPVVRRPVARAPQRAAVALIAARSPAHAKPGSNRAKPAPIGRHAQAPLLGNATTGAAANAPSDATPAPSAAPQVQIASADTHQNVGGYMPLGVDVAVPVLDPGVVRALAGLNVHVTLTVVVDENGHTKSVAFDPPLDPTLENQMRSMLATASWDPAVCGGGIACEGRTTIKL